MPACLADHYVYMHGWMGVCIIIIYTYTYLFVDICICMCVYSTFSAMYMHSSVHKYSTGFKTRQGDNLCWLSLNWTLWLCSYRCTYVLYMHVFELCLVTLYRPHGQVVAFSVLD
jgi:hypothetical protein